MPRCRRCAVARRSGRSPHHAHWARRRRKDAAGAGARTRHRRRGRDPSGVRSVGGHSRPAFVASAIAEALGLSDVTALDLPRRVRVACDDQPTLLVLDNFEQVLDAALLVADLLTSVAIAPGARPPAARRFVCGESASTSSDRSRWTEASMRCRPPISRAPPPCDCSWSAFGTCSPIFASHRRTAATVAAICRRLDALPLALELAAPWMKVLTAEELLRRLAQDVAALDDWPARSPRAPADDERDGGLELSAARPNEQQCIPAFRRAAGPFSDRGGRGCLRRSRECLDRRATKPSPRRPA